MGIGSDLMDQAWELYGDQLAEGDVEMVRVFYAHSRNCENVTERSLELTRVIAEKYVAAGKNKPSVQVVPGREDHRRHFKGDWDSWQESVVTRLDSITRKPVYDMFVVDHERCGRATANIIGAALTQGKAVFIWAPLEAQRRQSWLDQHGPFLDRVVRVQVVDPEDWTGGFSLWSAFKNEQLREEFETDGLTLEDVC